jgi:hypothetical protein
MMILGRSSMPFAVIARILSRLLLVAGVVVLRRRARGGARVPPSYRTPGTGGGAPAGLPEWLRDFVLGERWSRRVPGVVEGARLAGFALALAAFGAAGLALLSAGTTLTVLGPRWVGVVLLVLSALFALAAAREGVWLRRGVMLRRRRRRSERLAGGDESPV